MTATIAGRAVLVGLIATAAVGAAWWMVPDAFPTLAPSPRAPVGNPAVDRTAGPRIALAAPGAAGAASAVATGPAAITAEPPRFDVARVGARGMVVTAGRAAPGAEVILYAGGRELGRGRADARGEWVILPAEPLQPGARELSLAARNSGGDPVPARETLVLLVPDAVPAAIATGRGANTTGQDSTAKQAEAGQAEAGQAEAERSAGTASGPLAVLLPQGAAPATPRVLQGAARGADEGAGGGANGGTGGPDDGAARQRLRLDAVEYDEAGAMRFAGSAPPGSTIRIYVGLDHAGDALADAAGRWQLTPARQPVIGRHLLRMDQVAATGTVAARIEVPFQRDRLPEAAFAAEPLVVQPGQSLWRIARQVYGRGVHYTVIYQANREQIRDPGRIYPGQVFAMPGEATAAERLAPSATPGDAAQAASSRSR